MAEDRDGKTLAPTQKKLDDARKRGEVPAAPEARHALGMLALVASLLWFGASAATELARLAASLWSNAGDLRIESSGGSGFASGLGLAILRLMAPFLLIALGAALLTAFAQGRPSLSWTRVTPQWRKLSLVVGFGRLLGKQALVEFAKVLAKVAIVLLVAWQLFAPSLPGAEAMVGMEPWAIGTTASQLALSLLKIVLLLTAVIAAADIGWQRLAFARKMRMDHQELRDEQKESDGNPEVKARQRQLGQQRSRQRMMAAVPTASVVVTNPTHFAVALRYEHGNMRAPIVVAKGADRVALRIRELATQANVPLVENKPLARALYATAEVDRPIPVEQYAAVAEVISFVLRQTGKLRR